MTNSWPIKQQHQQGGGSPAAQIQSAPVPTPAPPVTATNAEVVQAEQDVAQQNLLKKSVKKTIYAGDTGAFKVGQPGYPGQPGLTAGGLPPPVSYKKLG